MTGLLKKCQTQSHGWCTQKMAERVTAGLIKKMAEKNGRDIQVSQLYISEIYNWVHICISVPR